MGLIAAIVALVVLPGSCDAWSNLDHLDLTAGSDGFNRGFGGGFSAGGWIYLTPFKSGHTRQGTRLVRLNQTDWGRFDDVDISGTGVGACAGSLAYGDYGYFTSAGSGLVLRVGLKDFSIVDTLDLAPITGSPPLGAAWRVGQHAYTTCGTLRSFVARIDLHNFGAGGVKFIDLSSLDPGLQYPKGSFTDSRRYGFSIHMYKIVRVGLDAFPNASAVRVMDVVAALGGHGVVGYKELEAGLVHESFAYVARGFQLIRFAVESFGDVELYAFSLPEMPKTLFADRMYLYMPPDKSDNVSRIRFDTFGSAAPSVEQLPLVAGVQHLEQWRGFRDGPHAYVVPTASRTNSYTDRFAHVVRFSVAPAPRCTTISKEMVEKYNAQRCLADV